MEHTQEEVFDRLVNCGCSELFAGFVWRFPNCHIANSFMARGSGGGVFTYLWKGNMVKAMQYADLENHKRLIILFSEDDWRKNFSRIPAHLEKKEEK